MAQNAETCWNIPFILQKKKHCEASRHLWWQRWHQRKSLNYHPRRNLQIVKNLTGKNCEPLCNTLIHSRWKWWPIFYEDYFSGLSQIYVERIVWCTTDISYLASRHKLICVSHGSLTSVGSTNFLWTRQSKAKVRLTSADTGAKAAKNQSSFRLCNSQQYFLRRECLHRNQVIFGSGFQCEN